MYAVRMESLGNAGPLEVEASPFHALMAARMAKEGVLRRLTDGGYLVAVAEGDLPAIVGLRTGSAGRIDVRACDGVHIARIEVFADVLDAEMRCTLLGFPADFMPEGKDAAPGRGGDGPGAGPRRDAVGATGPAARRDPVLSQIARDLPEIERILRGAGVPT